LLLVLVNSSGIAFFAGYIVGKKEHPKGEAKQVQRKEKASILPIFKPRSKPIPKGGVFPMNDSHERNIEETFKSD